VKKLLWMDDEIDDYLPIIESLELEGFEVTSIKHVDLAVEELSNNSFSAIILDQIMNGDPLFEEQSFSDDDMVWGGCLVLYWLLGKNDIAEAPQQINNLLKVLCNEFSNTKNSNLPIVILSSEISEVVDEALNRVKPEKNILSLQKTPDVSTLIEHLAVKFNI